LIHEGVWKPEETCIFEAEKRVGGRLMSVTGLGPGSLNDLVVDAIAFRFRHFHFFVKSVVDYFGMSTVCNEGDSGCAIVDTARDVLDDGKGNNIGYVSVIVKMLEELVDMGMRPVFGRHRLLATQNQCTLLTFELRDYNEKLYLEVSGPVFLNLPKSSLLGLGGDFSEMDKNSQLYQDLDSVRDASIVKHYVVYKDAFWVRMFGECLGRFTGSAGITSPPISGVFEDGDVDTPCLIQKENTTMDGTFPFTIEKNLNYCRKGLDKKCATSLAKGTMLSYYSSMTDYYMEKIGDKDDVIVWGTPWENSELLEEVHRSLMESFGLPYDAVALPVTTTLTVLDADRYPGVPGIEFCPADPNFNLRNNMMSPFPNVFVGNCAWGGIPAWQREGCS
jgi:hypothetical protein